MKYKKFNEITFYGKDVYILWSKFVEEELRNGFMFYAYIGWHGTIGEDFVNITYGNGKVKQLITKFKIKYNLSSKAEHSNSMRKQETHADGTTNIDNTNNENRSH